MYLTTRGLVLRVTPYNETDSLLTVLTQTNGMLTLRARGLRRKLSPLIAPCQLLAYGEFTIFEYRSYYTINEAHSIELFHILRKDLVKLSLGTYFAQVAESVCQEDTPNPSMLSLLLNCLYALSELSISEVLVKTVFELRCACLAGYAPDLHGCWLCDNLLPQRFDLTQGHLECTGCRNVESDGIRMPLSPGALDAMRYVCTCDEKRLFSFQIGDETLSSLSHLTESYLMTQLERGFSTLDFYKSLYLDQ